MIFHNYPYTDYSQINLDFVLLKLKELENKARVIDPDSVGTIELKDSAVTSEKLANGAVTTLKIVNNAITTEKIKDKAITAEKIDDLAINNEHLANNAVNGRVLDDYSVSTNKLIDLSVTSEKIVNGAINGLKLASNSVENEHIRDGAITNRKIENGAISDEKISDVGSRKVELEASQIGKVLKVDDSAHIGYATINELIPDNTLTVSKLSPVGATSGQVVGLTNTGVIGFVDVTGGGGGSSDIPDNSITADKLVDNIDLNGKLQTASIDGTKLKDSTIDDTKIINLDGQKLDLDSVDGKAIIDDPSNPHFTSVSGKLITSNSLPVSKLNAEGGAAGQIIKVKDDLSGFEFGDAGETKTPTTVYTNKKLALIDTADGSIEYINEGKTCYVTLQGGSLRLVEVTKPGTVLGLSTQRYTTGIVPNGNSILTYNSYGNGYNEWLSYLDAFKKMAQAFTGYSKTGTYTLKLVNDVPTWVQDPTVQADGQN